VDLDALGRVGQVGRKVPLVRDGLDRVVREVLVVLQ